MAEANPANGTARSQTRRRYYCHKCTAEVTPACTQEYTCPRCNNGFVEEIECGSSARRVSMNTPQVPEPPVEVREPAMEIREAVQSMLYSVLSPGGEASSRGAPRRSRRRRAAPYVEVRHRDRADVPLPGPMTMVRILRASRGPPTPTSLLQHLTQPPGNPSVPMNVMHIHGHPGDYAWGPGAMDAIVTQLLNQLENYGPPPAEGDKIEALPTVTISQDQVECTLQCSVCMDQFICGETVKQLPCNHHYHSPCIVPWLQLHGTCPVCRKDLNGQDTSTSDDDGLPAHHTTHRTRSPALDDPRT
ncbi:hypothetical protein ACOMHN_051529 [Nucella lapillus]